MVSQRYCCVCSNFSGKIVNGKKMSMHRFPVNNLVRRIWISRCKNARTGFKFTTWDQTRLCGHHFIGGQGPSRHHPLPVIFPKPDGSEKVYTLSTLDESHKNQIKLGNTLKEDAEEIYMYTYRLPEDNEPTPEPSDPVMEDGNSVLKNETETGDNDTGTKKHTVDEPQTSATTLSCSKQGSKIHHHLRGKGNTKDILLKPKKQKNSSDLLKQHDHENVFHRPVLKQYESVLHRPLKFGTWKAKKTTDIEKTKQKLQNEKIDVLKELDGLCATYADASINKLSVKRNNESDKLLPITKPGHTEMDTEYGLEMSCVDINDDRNSYSNQQVQEDRPASATDVQKETLVDYQVLKFEPLIDSPSKELNSHNYFTNTAFMSDKKPYSQDSLTNTGNAFIYGSERCGELVASLLSSQNDLDMECVTIKTEPLSPTSYLSEDDSLDQTNSLDVQDCKTAEVSTKTGLSKPVVSPSNVVDVTSSSLIQNNDMDSTQIQTTLTGHLLEGSSEQTNLAVIHDMEIEDQLSPVQSSTTDSSKQTYFSTFKCNTEEVEVETESSPIPSLSDDTHYSMEHGYNKVLLNFVDGSSTAKALDYNNTSTEDSGMYIVCTNDVRKNETLGISSIFQDNMVNTCNKVKVFYPYDNLSYIKDDHAYNAIGILPDPNVPSYLHDHCYSSTFDNISKEPERRDLCDVAEKRSNYKIVTAPTNLCESQSTKIIPTATPSNHQGTSSVQNVANSSITIPATSKGQFINLTSGTTSNNFIILTPNSTCSTQSCGPVTNSISNVLSTSETRTRILIKNKAAVSNGLTLYTEPTFTQYGSIKRTVLASDSMYSPVKMCSSASTQPKSTFSSILPSTEKLKSSFSPILPSTVKPKSIFSSFLPSSEKPNPISFSFPSSTNSKTLCSILPRPDDLVIFDRLRRDVFINRTKLHGYTVVDTPEDEVGTIQILSFYHYKGKTSIKESILIQKDFSLKLYVHQKEVSLQCLQLPTVVHCFSDLIDFIERLSNYNVCSGAMDKRYNLFVQGDRQVYIKGKCVGYSEDDFNAVCNGNVYHTTIRERTCLMLVEKKICRYCILLITMLEKNFPTLCNN